MRRPTLTRRGTRETRRPPVAPIRSARALAVLLVFGISSPLAPVAAQERASPPAVQNTAPVSPDRPARQITLVDLDGRQRAGELLQLAEGRITLRAAANAPIPLADLIAIHWTENSRIRRDLDPLVFLANGDQVRLRPEVMDEESLTLRWARFPTWAAVKLPLESLRGLIVDPPADRAVRNRSIARIQSHEDPIDLVLLDNGDSVTGELQSLDPQSLKLSTTSGEVALDRSRIRAIALNPELTSVPPLNGPGAVVRLIDGSRWHARQLRLTADDALAFVTQAGPELQIPLSAIESLQVLGGRVTYLSDLEPASYKFEPFLDLTWPLRRDVSVTGSPLRVRGTEYVKGLGMHSRSTVTYPLDGRYQQFSATIGIDDATAGQGSAIFQVLLDGRPAFTSDVLTGTSEPVRVGPLPLGKAKTLTLRVDYGPQGDILDHANWGDALLVK